MPNVTVQRVRNALEPMLGSSSLSDAFFSDYILVNRHLPWHALASVAKLAVWELLSGDGH